MRKAFTLLEALVLVAVAPMVMIAISGVFATFIRDIPRTVRVVQQNTTVLDMLEQLRRDVDGAVALPEQFNGQHVDDGTLLIEQPDRVISYRFADGKVVRALLAGQDDTALDDPRIWKAPDAVIAWQPWIRDDRACAVEIHSHVRQWVENHHRTKLAGTHLFFLQALGKEQHVR